MAVLFEVPHKWVNDLKESIVTIFGSAGIIITIVRKEYYYSAVNNTM